MPLLRSLPDIAAGVRFPGKAGAGGAGVETGCLRMNLIKDALAFIFNLIDIMAYRLTFR
jgi:hypothetical protein